MSEVTRILAAIEEHEMIWEKMDFPVDHVYGDIEKGEPCKWVIAKRKETAKATAGGSN